MNQKIFNSKLIIYLPILIIIFTGSCLAASNSNQFFIRTNQLGFLPKDLKTAVVFSQSPLTEKEFEIKNLKSKKTIFSGSITESKYTYAGFTNCYTIDFTRLSDPGNYQILVGGKSSYPFKIGTNIYNDVVDSLMIFFKVQRCGPTNPLLHDKCHLSDVVRLVGGNRTAGVDVTGGWHDAGDYIKFLSTSAYTTYMLMFAYEFDKSKFNFDNDNNGVPDVLEEAKVGLDWLLRCNFEKNKLVTQVQDLRDHEVGWRMPENDTLQYDRPGYVGMGKNIIGIYSAALSLASRIWKERFYEKEFSNKCLNTAKELYSIRNQVPDVDSSQAGTYQDIDYKGKLALGAVELYLSTKDSDYLNEAMMYADSAGSDYWWSWGNLNSLADYKIAKINPRFKDYIYNNLNSFNQFKDKSIFHEGMAFTWGSTNSFLGVALQAILYKDLTRVKTFDSLAVYQRDYILGRNPWGISFIYNIGFRYPLHLHSQIAYFHNGYLPGALSAGPAPQALLKSFNINRQNFKYNAFNSDSTKYYDDRNDYITNEPTIVGNATAVFVYGYFSNR